MVRAVLKSNGCVAEASAARGLSRGFGSGSYMPIEAYLDIALLNSQPKGDSEV